MTLVSLEYCVRVAVIGGSANRRITILRVPLFSLVQHVTNAKLSEFINYSGVVHTVKCF